MTTAPTVPRSPDVVTQEVKCPFCVNGVGLVPVIRQGDASTVNVKAPVQCRACQQWFKLHVQMKLIGVPLGAEDQRVPGGVPLVSGRRM